MAHWREHQIRVILFFLQNQTCCDVSLYQRSICFQLVHDSYLSSITVLMLLWTFYFTIQNQSTHFANSPQILNCLIRFHLVHLYLDIQAVLEVLDPSLSHDCSRVSVFAKKKGWVQEFDILNFHNCWYHVIFGKGWQSEPLGFHLLLQSDKHSLLLITHMGNQNLNL